MREVRENHATSDVDPDRVIINGRSCCRGRRSTTGSAMGAAANGGDGGSCHNGRGRSAGRSHTEAGSDCEVLAEEPCSGDAVLDRESTIGRVATTPLISGQPVFQNFLAPVDAVPGLASLVPKGMRAFTIRTPNIASGVAGFVMPGNHVDVLLTVAAPMFQTQGVITVTLLQRVQIMAVDQEMDAGADSLQRMTQMKSVTLLVTPEQAAKLSLAQNGGTLELSLRNPADSQPASPAPITVADLRLRGELPDENRSNREQEKQELIASVQEKMDARLREMQKNLDQTTKMLRESSRAKVTKAPATSELRIRTLRGTHGGLVFVRPGEAAVQDDRE